MPRDLQRSTSPLTEACRTGACGPTLAMAYPTVSVSMRKGPFGTPTFLTNVVFVCAKAVRYSRQITVDRGCFASMLGGGDKKRLFVLAAGWHGPANMVGAARTGQVLFVDAPAPRAGWP